MTTAKVPGLLLPEGAILVHIGPHKTATTSIQAALHDTRAALRVQGVTYPGRGTKAGDAIRAVRGARAPSGRVPPMREWRALVKEAKAARAGRVVISNEFLSEASPDVIRTISTDLDLERIHIVATLRSLDRILPSQWQQFVQSGLTKPFDAWLEETLREPGIVPGRFWLRHRHDRLVARWAETVGTDRVSVVVVDERDPGHVLRVFEDFLGLRPGTLSAATDPRNRSMTWAEIEAVRALNLACEAQGMNRRLHYPLIQRGVCEYMKRRTPDRDEPRVTLPTHAAERVAAVAREVVDGIVATGVRVIGDLERLAPASPDLAESDGAPTWIDAGVSAWLSMGVLDALGAGSASGGSLPSESADLAGIPTLQLAVAIGRRPGDAILDWLRLVARRAQDDGGS